MYWGTVRLNSTLKIKKKNQTSTTFKQTAPHSKADKIKAQSFGWLFRKRGAQFQLPLQRTTFKVQCTAFKVLF